MESIARSQSLNNKVTNMAITKILKEIGRNAHIDWIVVICLSVSTAIGLAIAGFYLYNAVVTGSLNKDEQIPVVSAPKFDVKAISTAVHSFKQREEATKRAKVGYKGFPDPSI